MKLKPIVQFNLIVFWKVTKMHEILISVRNSCAFSKHVVVFVYCLVSRTAKTYTCYHVQFIITTLVCCDPIYNKIDIPHAKRPLSDLIHDRGFFDVEYGVNYWSEKAISWYFQNVERIYSNTLKKMHMQIQMRQRQLLRVLSLFNCYFSWL